jgi:hypothetical protein
MYVLVICDLVPIASKRALLPNLLQNLQDKSESTLENQMISEGVWLFDLNSELSFFRHLLDWADDNTISYKISYFETKPEFI